MISVIIATHKRASLLDEALRHIFAQEDAIFEVIVVNDIDSYDETDDVLKKYPTVKYIKNSQIQGPSNKYKKGYEIAQGDFLYMPNDDDYITDNYFFAKCEKILQEMPDLSFVSGNADILNEFEDNTKSDITRTTMNLSGRIPSKDYIQHFQEAYNKPLSTCSTIFRKAAFDCIGMQNIIEFSDSSQYLLALLYGDAYIMDDAVAVYRVQNRKSNLTYNASKRFILNVLRQKEDIYIRAKSFLPSGRDFWANQFKGTYSIVSKSNLKKCERFHICIWGIIHSHCSPKLLISIIKQMLLTLSFENKSNDKI